jgi:PHD/YefM family antitoxin component YafN of YafNO toxin-antitoxin module
MRNVTIAEAEKNLPEVLDLAAHEPVRLQRDGHDLIVVSAVQFEEVQEQLRKQRIQGLLDAMERCSEEARNNGFMDDMLPNLLRR